MQTQWTARKMADALAPSPSEDDRAKAMRRIQHWTAEELVDPISLRHSGRGTVRRYSPASLLEAALLWEMAERNLSIEQMRMALAVIRFSRDETDPFEIALKGSRRVLALINLSDRFRLQADLDPVDPTIPQDWAVGIWIDLTAAFARLRPHLLNGAQGEP
jgi:hypothetical protein